MKFLTETYGKWILTGEQAVVRGYPAIVFPLANYKLQLDYQYHDYPLQIIAPNTHCAAISKIWQQAWSNTHPPKDALIHKGCLTISSNIPIGQGLGASAALCLAISQCIYHFSKPNLSLWEFAKNLENIFHGRSSGIDILGSGSQRGIWFEKGQYRPIKLAWQPNWLLTYTGEIGETSQAVAKVQQLFNSDENTAQRLDLQMAQSTYLAERALSVPMSEGLKLLIESMNLARDCFQQWGLITKGMQQHMDILKQKGALAVKPTGSGGGGFLLSLWPPTQQLDALIDSTNLRIILPADNKSHLF